ncbi:histone-lysine N-methyltransferase SETMAR [Elysia marginata]|uniref:Histone-lysine N-methyltransferase SETMAR n=1 Tax=Elysia marginata TaxID=1093978 RepID=A0AAV4J2C7_9GAST|nr:histone-lysine N-methyltransferase SETMAR [Elysia marginata]
MVRVLCRDLECINGKLSLDKADELKSGRPKTSTNEENTTRVHLNTLDTKRNSITWKYPSSPETKKFKVQRSAAKMVATVFCDAKGVILLDILPQGQCINAAQYCRTLDRLRDAIRRKRPGLLRRGVVLQHDKATPHSANLAQ